LSDITNGTHTFSAFGSITNPILCLIWDLLYSYLFTVASSSDLSQFTNRNVTRKLTPISPGRYVLKRPRNLHCGDLNKATVAGSNENQSFYLECDENGEDCDVPDNDLGKFCY